MGCGENQEKVYDLIASEIDVTQLNLKLDVGKQTMKNAMNHRSKLNIISLIQFQDFKTYIKC